MDAAIGAGGNYLSVGGMTAELSPGLRREVTNQAREQAVDDGKSVAETLAKAAGVTLGPVRAISDTNIAPMPPVPMAGECPPAAAAGQLLPRPSLPAARRHACWPGCALHALAAAAAAALRPRPLMPRPASLPQAAMESAKVVGGAADMAPTPVKIGTTDVSAPC